jgi:methionyl-tRNA formyltransferase
LRQPAMTIWRRVRAFYPWPGCYTTWRGRILKIVGAAVLPDELSPGAGRVVALSGRDKGLGIGTGEGVLGVLRLQLEGRRVMSAAEFLHGQRDFIGSVLPC